MHRLPLRQREVGELNALTRIIGVAANAKSKIHRVASYRMRTIDHSDKVLSSPQPPPLLPWFLRARHPLSILSGHVRSRQPSYPSHEKCLLCIFLRTTEKRIRRDSYICTSNRTDTCPTRRARYVDLLSRMGRLRKQSRTTITYALLLIIYGTLTVCHCCYVFPKGTQTRIITRLE